MLSNKKLCELFRIAIYRANELPGSEGLPDSEGRKFAVTTETELFPGPETSIIPLAATEEEAERLAVEFLDLRVHEALLHVHSIFPSVTHVFYSADGRWLYCDDFFEAPAFAPTRGVGSSMPGLALGLLETAADSVKMLPAAFALKNVSFSEESANAE